MIQVIGVAVLLTAAAIILIDFIPAVSDWTGRIRIGRYESREDWYASMMNKGMRWLTNTPKMKVTDNTRLIFIDMMRGTYSSRAIQHWQEAALLLGLAENDRNAVAQEEIRQFLQKTFQEDGQWREKPKHIDGAILAYAVMKVSFVDTNTYKSAFDSIWDMIQDYIGADGTVMYRKHMNHYRYVDTIGFICPFLILYGLRYGKNECIELAMRQIEEYERHGMLQHTFIPSHAYDAVTKLPLGLYGWGRGLGWFAIGLADAWNELPADHPSKTVLTETIVRFAKAAMSFQQENGSWSWTVTRRESRPDSSTTAVLGWFMTQAAQIETLSEGCMESADRAAGYLMTVTRRSGAIDFSQGDTKDIGVYAMLFGILPFTQGFAIRLENARNLLRKG